MCTIQKPKKRFDYDAYIQGRLIGKYVVIYHDEIPEEPEIKASDVEGLQHLSQPLIAILPDDDVQELSEINVFEVMLNQSHLKAAIICAVNCGGLAAYKIGEFAGAKPNFPNGRAGPPIDSFLLILF